MTITDHVTLPPIVSREEWAAERANLLVQEKALMKHKDAVASARRRLPMVEITTPYTFAGEHGPVSLLDLFAGRTQLIVQHFMFGTDWTEGCVGCSMMADHIAPLQHLHARDTSLALISRAPLEKLLAYRERMGWRQLPWVSSAGTTFNDDFGATVDGNEESVISSFIRDDDRVFHTWSTTGRGAEIMIGTLDLLDLTPYGRQETWQDAPEGWPQGETGDWWNRHDRYDSTSGDSCH